MEWYQRNGIREQTLAELVQICVMTEMHNACTMTIISHGCGLVNMSRYVLVIAARTIG